GPSAPSAPPPLSLGAELKDVFKVFRSQEIPAYKTFVQREPILRAAQPYALQQLKNLGLYQPTLQKVFQTQLAPVMLSGGALTPGQRTAAEQQALGLSARAGMATGPQGNGGALLRTAGARPDAGAADSGGTTSCGSLRSRRDGYRPAGNRRGAARHRSRATGAVQHGFNSRDGAGQGHPRSRCGSIAIGLRR